MLKELKPAEILNRALVITQASCQTHNNLSSMFEFFLLTKLDNEEMILKKGDLLIIPNYYHHIFKPVEGKKWRIAFTIRHFGLD